MSGRTTRHPDLYGIGPRVSRPHPKQGPRNPAADLEYERSQAINRDDRKAMLRRHFEAGGMTDAEIDAHLTKAKV